VVHFQWWTQEAQQARFEHYSYTPRTPLKSVPEIFHGTLRNLHIATILDVSFYQINMLLWFDKYKSGHVTGTYEGWNFNSGNYLFTTDTK